MSHWVRQWPILYKVTNIMILPPTNSNCHHHKVTKIIVAKFKIGNISHIKMLKDCVNQFDCVNQPEWHWYWRNKYGFESRFVQSCLTIQIKWWNSNFESWNDTGKRIRTDFRMIFTINFTIYIIIGNMLYIIYCILYTVSNSLQNSH